MSHFNIDLNVDNYSIKELEHLLNITKDDYNLMNILNKSKELKTKIFTVSSLDNEKKKDIELFLKDVVNRLEKNLIINKLAEFDNTLIKLLELLN
tara:strand:- start:244 stop:528 length:285 start_codon:yes stop_codon:yes gene_type:complete